MWDAIPWILLASGVGLISWIVYLKFTGKDVPGWMIWMSYALNAFAMLALALGRIGRGSSIGDDGSDVPTPIPVPKPEPHLDDAEDIVEDAKIEGEKAAEEKRDEGDSSAASGFASTFGSNIGKPKPPKENP